MSLVWVAFGLVGPGPRQRAPSREGGEGEGRQRGRQKQHREEAQGSATDGLFLFFLGGPVPGKGRPGRSRDWSRRVGCL